MRKTSMAAIALSFPILLAGCSSGRLVGNDEYGTDSARERILRESGRNPRDAGLIVFGVDRNQPAEQGGGPGGVSVNAYLWRATLET
ncbi:MAG: hypothetical protein K2X32_02415, partial [Phycisphaerales bacterium]|nr:hypothetical protein [Phycisphaerales bacterium]